MNESLQSTAEPRRALLYFYGARASEIGRRHGVNAVEWWQQEALGGHATGDTKARAAEVLQGIEDGDPAVLDALPTWDDGYTETDLKSDCGWPHDVPGDAYNQQWNAVLPHLRDSYRMSFDEAVVDEVAAVCREEIGGVAHYGRTSRLDAQSMPARAEGLGL